MAENTENVETRSEPELDVRLKYCWHYLNSIEIYFALVSRLVIYPSFETAEII